MTVRKFVVLFSVVATVATGTALGEALAVEGIGIPAAVVAFTPEKITADASTTYPTTDFGATNSAADDRQGSTQWRVVLGTGNCCENHLGVTSDGRLFDIAGSYVNYTDDRGLTWRRVQPQTPLVNGEGSIVTAPNGDVLGIEWDAYTGDHLLAYKYNAASGKWFYLDAPLHHPVYDRPWISVVPGPFAIGLGADTVPYITFVQGGTGLKDPMFVSTDGLTYHEASSLIVDGQTDTPVSGWFPIQADASFDWIQPIRSSPVTPLGNGRALANGGWLLDPADRHWDAWRLPDNTAPPTFIQIDSRGRIHHLRSVTGGFEYRISADQGRTWTTTMVPFPLGLSDFHVNAAIGVAAVATRVNNQDWVYKFDIGGASARLTRRYKVGLGDARAAPGVGQLTAPRFDFDTLAILPDGRVAMSFLDSTTLSHPPGTGMLGRLTPALAIEMDTTLPSANADVALTATDSPDPVVVGDPLTYTLHVENRGPDQADAVTLTDRLPAGVRFDAATSGCREWLGTVTCSLGTLAAGAAADVSITVTPQEPGTLVNDASILAGTTDPDHSNDAASTTTSAVCTITGTAGADTLRGTARRDVICGLGGDDVISGLDGGDLLLGGDGVDRITGNAGDDDLRGNAGDDDLKGSEGNDALSGGSGVDRLNGGAGTDACSVDEDGGTTQECERAT